MKQEKTAYLVNLDGSLLTDDDISKYAHLSDKRIYLDSLVNVIDNQNTLILHSDEVYIVNSGRTEIASDLAMAAIDSAETLAKICRYYA